MAYLDLKMSPQAAQRPSSETDSARNPSHKKGEHMT